MASESSKEGATVRVALSAEDLADLDTWIAEYQEGRLSRPEAIRYLIRIAVRLDREWQNAKRAAARAPEG